MKSLNFKLEQFEGPLDLLISLIEKNKIDICDIEISLLLDQYLEYLDMAKKAELDLTADFLDMASTLIYIKSRTLLPKIDEEDNDDDDPKLLLERQIAEYAKYKKSAEYLSKKSLYGIIYFREKEPQNLPSIPKEYKYSFNRITEAYKNVLDRFENKKPITLNSFSKIIGTRFISIKCKIISVLRMLLKKEHIGLLCIFKGMKDRSEIVASFLAVLELIRSGRVTVSEDDELSLVKRHVNE